MACSNLSVVAACVKRGSCSFVVFGCKREWSLLEKPFKQLVSRNSAEERVRNFVTSLRCANWSE